jgi:hypothetical protein
VSIMPPFDAESRREPIEAIAHKAREPVQIADRVEPDRVLHDLGPLGIEELGEELHGRRHFVGRARPVLRAEGVKGERLEPNMARLARDRPGAPRYKTGPCPDGKFHPRPCRRNVSRRDPRTRPYPFSSKRLLPRPKSRGGCRKAPKGEDT